MKSGHHIWSFSTVGGVKRVNLETGADLLHLSQLDPKLWTALSCPINGLEIDRKTLELIDKDNDNQIRVPEVIEAVNWVTSVLKNPNDLLKQESVFPLSAINDDTDLGKSLLKSAQTILKNLGKESNSNLTVEDTTDLERIFAGTRFNGDGVITEDTAINSECITLINEIIQCLGSVTDRGGKQGITLELIHHFTDCCEKYSSWIEKKEINKNAIFPFGASSEIAYLNYLEIKSKIDDFFIRCRLAAFDPQSTEALNLQVARVEMITSQNLSTCLDDIAAYPIAKIAANKPLPLNLGINPAWEIAIDNFKTLTVNSLYQSKETISEQEWKTVTETFAPYAQWLSEKEGAIVEVLGIDRIAAILSSNEKEQLVSLIEQDKALEEETKSIILVDQLVRYHRDLFTLLKNFVTFFDFYRYDSKAIFQAGTLYIDQRSCDLCIKVTDMPKHALMVSFSGMYLIYCDCISRATNEKMIIVAALTNGDVDNLVVGKNALFYDRSGLDWDATVIKIVDNPISIRQAFFSPYRKASRFIEKQINKMAASQDEKVSANMAKSIENAPHSPDDVKTKKDPPVPFDIGKFVGIFAAIGLAIGAIGTTIAAVIAGFLGLSWWKMPLAMLGVLFLISTPSMIMAFLKLRKRNLAPILDANGWAINARAIVNIPFGNTLTHLAELPRGARINLNDPFTKKQRPILPAILFVSLITGALLYFLWKYKLIHWPF